MIEDQHKFIFVRNPKTASTSIHLSLNKNKSNIQFNFIRLKEATGKAWDNTLNGDHPDCSQYKRFFPKKYEQYFKFSFVRNPWARIYSIYIESKNFYLKFYEKESITFEKFLNSISNHQQYLDFTNQLRKLPTTKRFDQFGNQYRFTKGCDFIGKFENLQKDFYIICDKLSIPHLKIFHKNRKHPDIKYKNYLDGYNNKTKKIVADLCHEDIKHFGYEFGK